MQKANELYEIYYEIYAQFKYELDEAKLPIIKYRTNSSDKTRNKKKRKSDFRTFFCRISVTDIRQ